jgi:glycerol-3-phosphate dehydrogenase
MSVIAIVGAGMMGSALSAPFVANGHEVRLVGTPLDHDIIAALKASAPQPSRVSRHSSWQSWRPRCTAWTRSRSG